MSKSMEVELRLAIRDRIVKNIRYDKEGKRVYEKFEMDEGDEDGNDEEDDGYRHVAWGEIVEPKLVKAASLQEAEVEVSGRRYTSFTRLAHLYL